MNNKASEIVAFLADVERLKLVNRSAYVSDLSRRQNSAEHCWLLAMGLLTVAREFKLNIDLNRALLMALIHHMCEIDAGTHRLRNNTRRSTRCRETLHRKVGGLRLAIWRGITKFVARIRSSNHSGKPLGKGFGQIDAICCQSRHKRKKVARSVNRSVAGLGYQQADT
jgi:hypothetical protein